MLLVYKFLYNFSNAESSGHLLLAPKYSSQNSAITTFSLYFKAWNYFKWTLIIFNSFLIGILRHTEVDISHITILKSGIIF